MKKDNKQLPELKVYNSRTQVTKDWLHVFNNVMVGKFRDDLDFLSENTEAIERIKKEVVGSRNSYNRDLAVKGTKLPQEVDTITVEPSSVDFEFYRCEQCLQKVCDCEKNWSGSTCRYSPDDYRPVSMTEDGLIFNAKLLRALQELNLSSYGDCEPNLKKGDRVRICLNSHLYQGHWGVIIGERRKGEYLIEIRSRMAPKGRGKFYNPEPVNGRMYARAEALSLVEVANAEAV